MPGFIINDVGQGAPAAVKPYYKYTWEVQQLFGEIIGQNPPADRLPVIYLKDATLPSWDFDKEEVQGSSLWYKFAKSIKWNDIKLTWYDTVGLATKIQQWRQAIWTPADGLQNPNDYKKVSVLRSLTFSWNNPVSWKLINSWPANVKLGDLTYTDSEIKIVDITLSYDWAEESF